MFGDSTPSSQLVREAIAEKKLPGAVVLVGRGDRILYQKAIGNRALVPAAEPMTVDTIFDLGSLTKVVATTTSVMMLVEQGRIRLSDRVVVLRARLRALRQGRYHHTSPADPRVGVAARRRSGGAVGRVRNGDRARGRRGAGVASRRALRLQRHQLLPPRRHRAARERAAARSVSRASTSSSRSG